MNSTIDRKRISSSWPLPTAISIALALVVFSERRDLHQLPHEDEAAGLHLDGSADGRPGMVAHIATRLIHPRRLVEHPAAPELPPRAALLTWRPCSAALATNRGRGRSTYLLFPQPV